MTAPLRVFSLSNTSKIQMLANTNTIFFPSQAGMPVAVRRWRTLKWPQLKQHPWVSFVFLYCVCLYFLSLTLPPPRNYNSNNIHWSNFTLLMVKWILVTFSPLFVIVFFYVLSSFSPFSLLGCQIYPLSLLAGLDLHQMIQLWFIWNMGIGFFLSLTFFIWTTNQSALCFRFLDTQVSLAPTPEHTYYRHDPHITAMIFIFIYS